MRIIKEKHGFERWGCKNKVSITILCTIFEEYSIKAFGLIECYSSFKSSYLIWNNNNKFEINKIGPKLHSIVNGFQNDVDF